VKRHEPQNPQPVQSTGFLSGDTKVPLIRAILIHTYNEFMKKLTLLIDDDIYDGLHRAVGRGHIGRFISDKVRPHLPAANDEQTSSAFGLLAHLAKPVTAEGMAQAKRAYLQKRYASKASA
jgi:hypothetical protein